MCGRYALSATPAELIETFKLARCIDFKMRYNAAPTSLMPVVRQSPEGDRVADLLRWGLIPNWAKDPSIGARLNNARGESLSEKPSFRDAFKRRRCLIPASGFFEWKTEGKVKQPYYVSYSSGQPLAMAGLWESWQDASGEIVRTYCVITTAANAVMEPIHDRMPLLINPSDYSRWIDPQVPGVDLISLIAPAPASGMQIWPVGRAVSKSTSEGPELILPAEIIRKD